MHTQLLNHKPNIVATLYEQWAFKEQFKKNSQQQFQDIEDLNDFINAHYKSQKYSR